ncbi:hypothetical protein BD310DRAFT_962386 [Dichomitus squalens]|uniref:Uncharacterized protein n=1 Tax=Dichomitus squalens TaxID=114155 RepID=A0A4Q9PHB1_9APHY|nr:hypothetical protein BD310DRAFT_962386 [Dichomitus squalens]
MDRTLTARPLKRSAPLPNYSDRAQARIIRQKLLEHEQEIEDRQAFNITPEELRILTESFSSVKAEFTDLDGLSWETPLARQVLLAWHSQQAARSRGNHAQHLDFAILAGRIRRSPSSNRSLASILAPPRLSTSSPDPCPLTRDPQATLRPTTRHARSLEEQIRVSEVVRAFTQTDRPRRADEATVTPTASFPSHFPRAAVGETERAPLPALFEREPVPDGDVGRTPRPPQRLTTVDYADVHANGLALTTPVPAPARRGSPSARSGRLRIVKSHSAPSVPLAVSSSPPPTPSLRSEHVRDGNASTLDATGSAQANTSRPTKSLPPSRIPLLRTKSLGAKSTAQLASRAVREPGSTSSVTTSISTPTFTFCAGPSYPPSSGAKSADTTMARTVTSRARGEAAGLHSLDDAPPTSHLPSSYPSPCEGERTISLPLRRVGSQPAQTVKALPQRSALSCFPSSDGDASSAHPRCQSKARSGVPATVSAETAGTTADTGKDTQEGTADSTASSERDSVHELGDGNRADGRRARLVLIERTRPL